MESQGHGRFKKQISLIDMILVGIGAIIGSGWLFASGLVASIAGPAGWISWVIGGSPCSCSVWSTLNWAPRFRGRVTGALSTLLTRPSGRFSDVFHHGDRLLQHL